VEILDDPSVDADARARSNADIVASNKWLGGRRAVLDVLDEAIRSCVVSDATRELTLLDVGTGLGDLPGAARPLARKHGVTLTAIGVDRQTSLLAAAGSHLDERITSDALMLPFADASVDIVMCSQILHHFEHAEAVSLVRELHRVASRRVIVCDLRRSWIAAGGFKVAAVALRFHPITHHDGVTSVLRGFTEGELGRIIEEATGVHAVVRRHLGYRLTASWSPLSSRTRVTNCHPARP
jgi:2-polyprenyl-3-methyl-5-hydroxy-6-metoxy-1,4-benzoquinol methylase